MESLLTIFRPVRGLAAAAIVLVVAGCATMPYERFSRPEKKRYFELAAVCMPDELKEYAALPDSAAREQYWQVFWKKKDPTPTTERNERYEEHLSRVTCADENFPSSNYQWDDRGKVYIKYGEPDERVWYPTGDGSYPNAGDEGVSADPRMVAPSRPWERWYYGRYRSTFCFVERDAGYRLVSDLNSAKSADAGATIYSLQSFDVERPALTEEMPGDAYHHEYGQALDFPFGVSRFGDSLGAEVWIYYSVPLAALAYDSTGTAQLSRRIVIFDQKMREAARDDKSLTPPDMGRKIADAQAIDVVRFRLEPGDYTVAISLEDTRAGKTGIYEYKFPVINYLKDAKGASDLLLAREIMRDTVSTKFNKCEYRIVPQPGNSFKAGTNLYMYYEIYNIQPDTNSRCQVEIKYYFVSLKNKIYRGTAPVVQTSATSRLDQAASLSLNDLPEGSYNAIVKARDLVSGKEQTLISAFTIVK